MRKSTMALLAVGGFALVFGAVLAALQLNRVLESRTEPKVERPREGWLVNASADPLAAGDFRAAAKRAVESVVSIDTQVEGENWFGERVVQSAGQGSGVILSSTGTIVTNNHVLRARSFRGDRLVDKVNVTFYDGSTSPAKIVGTDPRSDLAVLKVEKTNLKPIVVGDSGKLEVGEWVLAIGNPLGYENTLSVGVVSNVGRQLPGGGNSIFIDGIQTDAAINMGNSGGALTNARGELVGINTAIASIGGGSIGIGFAIPVNRMRQVVEDILKNGYARYGSLGVEILRRPGVLTVPDAREELRRRTGAKSDPPDKGVVVMNVAQDSAAFRAGIRPLDVITEMSGKSLTDIEDFSKQMSPRRPGDRVQLKVWSAGTVKSLSVALDEAPRQAS
jgi:S1-C subfamily serine protease